MDKEKLTSFIKNVELKKTIIKIHWMAQNR